jgi:hypothetical protein
MKFDVRVLAARKHAESGHDEVDWLRALESARQSLKFVEIDYESLERIALASRTPAQFTLLTRLIYQYGKSHPNGDLISEVILKYASESPFSLSDWLAAIEYFHGWLEQNGRKIDFLPMLKYLECCIAAPDARESGQTFVALIEDMLKVSGYEG